MNPKIEYPNRNCTLCNDKDIQDEYHMVLKCVYFQTLRMKFIIKYYYVRPSMYKFQQLINTRENKEYCRLMLFVNHSFILLFLHLLNICNSCLSFFLAIVYNCICIDVFVDLLLMLINV